METTKFNNEAGVRHDENTVAFYQIFLARLRADGPRMEDQAVLQRFTDLFREARDNNWIDSLGYPECFTTLKALTKQRVQRHSYFSSEYIHPLLREMLECLDNFLPDLGSSRTTKILHTLVALGYDHEPERIEQLVQHAGGKDFKKIPELSRFLWILAILEKTDFPFMPQLLERAREFLMQDCRPTDLALLYRFNKTTGLLPEIETAQFPQPLYPDERRSIVSMAQHKIRGALVPLVTDRFYVEAPLQDPKLGFEMDIVLIPKAGGPEQRRINIEVDGGGHGLRRLVDSFNDRVKKACGIDVIRINIQDIHQYSPEQLRSEVRRVLYKFGLLL